jgi:hypothetical protein
MRDRDRDRVMQLTSDTDSGISIKSYNLLQAVMQSYMRVRNNMLNWNFSKGKDEKRVEELLPEGWKLKEASYTDTGILL